MAKKRTEPEEDTPDAKRRGDDKKLIEELLSRYKKCVEADKPNRDGYREDMKFVFVPGEQWDQAIKTARGKDRPMLEFNELRIKVKSTINHIRTNRPAAKIRPVEDGDVERAEVMQGITSNIYNRSDADSITDYAAEHQVAGGMGAWEVVTEYCDDSVSDQDIYLKSLLNPLCLYADYACIEQDKSDARFWIKHSKLDRDEFKAKYPEAKSESFEPDEQLEADLDDEDSVWIAEYWKKVPITKNLALLTDGKTVDLDAEKAKGNVIASEDIVKQREVPSHKIVSYICSSSSVLSGPHDWAGKEFPFVIVYGEFVVIDGKQVWYGMARHSKDAQRAHNESMTSVFETISASPQAKYWATPEQAKGHSAQWAESFSKNLPAMLFNPDPKQPGAPVRVGGADVPAALIQASAMSRDGIKSTTGVPDAVLGEISNEQSGRAIRARQSEGQVATYNFPDNMSKAMRRTYEILLDLVPKIIDTPRAIRILGKDGAEKFIRVNQPDPVTGEIENDLSVGKFDIVVTQGPSYATQRQEAVETYSALVQSYPELAQVAGDLIVEKMDLPGAEAIAQRLKLILPPQIQQALQQQGSQSPEVVAAMGQVQQLMQQVTQQGQLVQQAAEEAKAEQAKADKAKADVQVAAANLETKSAQIATQEAQLAQSVAEFQRLVAETQAKAAENGMKIGESMMTDHVNAALQAIHDQAGALVGMYAQELDKIQQHIVPPPPEVIVQAEPKPVSQHVSIERVNGKPVGRVVKTYENGDVKEHIVSVDRNGSDMTAVIQSPEGSRVVPLKRANGRITGQV